MAESYRIVISEQRICEASQDDWRRFTLMIHDRCSPSSPMFWTEPPTIHGRPCVTPDTELATLLTTFAQGGMEAVDRMLALTSPPS